MSASLTTKTRTGRGLHAAAVPVLVAALVVALLPLCTAARADDLSEMGPRTNLQVALWETEVPGEKAALQELLFNFQRANPDVIVCLEWQDAGLQDEWTRRWFGAQHEYAPDVTVMSERRAWENRHALLDMPDEFGRQLRSDYERSVMRRMPGQARGVPWQVSTYALYYRPDLLAEVELTVPETLEQMADCAEALADPPGRYGLGFPAPSGGGEELLHALAQAIGAADQAPEGEEADEGRISDERRASGDPDYAEGLEMLVDLQSRGALQPEILTWSESDLVDLFVEGRLGMLIAPISAARELRAVEEPPEWASTPLPLVEGGVGQLSVEWMVAFADTDRPEVAVRLLHYIAEAESQRMLAMLPSVPSMRRIAEELGDQSPWQAHVAPLKRAEGVPLAQWDRRKPQLGEALVYALSGRQTPREALAKARAEGE